LELRHLRYFVAVAEEGSLTRAGARLRVAQPAISRQIRQLEREIGAPLLERSPKGVKLTAAGAAFLVEARRAIEHAALAVETARGAVRGAETVLRFAHGELFRYIRTAEELLAGFRAKHPGVKVAVRSQDDAATCSALVEGRVDVGCVFLGEWPPQGFEGHRLLRLDLDGVLLPSGHPLARASSVALRDLRGLPWVTLGPQRWPGFHELLEDALRARGIEPRGSTSPGILSPFLHVAAGAGWALANKESGAPYRRTSSAIVYRPFVDPAIPAYLALVWVPPAPAAVERLAETARSLGFFLPNTRDRKASSRPA